MEITGKVYCLFEQSGTFKKAFKERGIEAIDIDIQNEFQETDLVCDIFCEIEKAYLSVQGSIFDDMKPDDLVFAFFPCTYFAGANALYFMGKAIQYKNLSYLKILDDVIDRNSKRNAYYNFLLKLVYVAARNNLRLIIENPYGKCSYLMHNFVLFPGFLDVNRTLYGDKFIKPTMYYYLNCTLGDWKTKVFPKEIKKITDTASSKQKGLCSTARSMISEEYANNFVEEIVLGERKSNNQLSLDL